jgi:hypothetical protein
MSIEAGRSLFKVVLVKFPVVVCTRVTNTKINISTASKLYPYIFKIGCF